MPQEANLRDNRANRARRTWRRPRNRIEAELAAAWQSLLDLPALSVDDDFFDLGGNAEAGSLLLALIESSFGVKLPFGTLFEAPTVAALSERVAQRAAIPEWEHVVPLQPFGQAPPLFCVHNYNGEVWLYAQLARRLAPDQPVYGLQAAAVRCPRPPLLTIERMAEQYLTEIRSLQPRGPYHVGGICFGAYVSLEIARQLMEAGEEVGLVASFDTFAYPAEPVSEQMLGLSARGQRLWSRFDPDKPGEWLSTTRAILAGRVSRFARNANIYAFERGLRSRAPCDDDARRDLLSALNHRARQSYRPSPYAGKVTFIRCSGGRDKDPNRFWGAVAEQGVECIEILGEHASMLEREHVGRLAEALRGCMRRSAAPEPDSGAGTPI